jgi:hypothetical protein
VSFHVSLFSDFECGFASIARINLYLEHEVLYFFVWFSKLFSAVWAINHHKRQTSAFFERMLSLFQE